MFGLSSFVNKTGNTTLNSYITDVKYNRSDMNDPFVQSLYNEIVDYCTNNEVIINLVKSLDVVDASKSDPLSDMYTKGKNKKVIKNDDGKEVAESVEIRVDRHIIDLKIQNLVGKTAEYIQYTDLFEDIHGNAYESALFNVMVDFKIKLPNVPTFDTITFNDLIKRIKHENHSFFPMRDFINNKFLKAPNFIYVPSEKKEYEQYNFIETAAAFATGDFVYNIDFLQTLITFAYKKGIQGNSLKYVSKGGDIPDHYCYIETVIMHENLHFTYGDMMFHRIFNESHKLINYAGDFRSNHILTKSGYAQLPIGLYSNKYNMDNYITYRELVKAIKEELMKLPKNDDGQGEGESSSHDTGKGKKSKSQGKSSKDKSDDSQDSQEQESQESSDGQGDKKEDDVADKLDDFSSDDHPESKDEKEDKNKSMPTEEELEKHMKDIENKLSARKDIKNNDEVDLIEKQIEADQNGRSSSTGEPDKGIDRDYNRATFDYTKIRPTYKWQQLLDKMVKNSVGEEETYRRPNKRAISNMVTGLHTGTFAVKPSEIPSTDDRIKLVIVVDSSGSMDELLPKVYSNLTSLLKTNGVESKFYLIKFSNDFTIYKCDFSSNIYSIVDSELKSQSPVKGSVKDLFSKSFSGGTNFSDELIVAVKSFIEDGMNVIGLSDSDVICDGDNFKNFYTFIKSSSTQAAFILDQRSTFESACSRLKTIPVNLSYLED